MDGEERFKKEEALRGSFVSFDGSPDNTYTFFLKTPKTKKLCITREHPEKIKEKYGRDFEIFWMNQKMLKERGKLLEQIQKNIKGVMQSGQQSIILLERVDYLINLYGFDAFLKFIYGINDELFDSKSTLLVHCHNSALNEQQKNLLGLELKELPKPAFVENIRLAKDLFDILSFIREQETKVSFKTICKKFSITKATARKRVYDLHGKNLVVIKKDGRSKIVELTREGYGIL
jgi:predicted transcriptional regulator